jgi:hypothetical protein
MLEFEHQAEHWDTPEHGETGHLIAQALRAAVDIARGGGLDCKHRAEDDRLASPVAEARPVRLRKIAKPPLRPASARAS